MEGSPAFSRCRYESSKANNSKGLAGEIERKRLDPQDDDNKLELYRQVDGLYETKLKEPQRAFVSASLSVRA